MMSEQEKKSGSNIGVSPVAMVEQSQESRHKQPYRPIELQEETPDQHHKRSRAPAVPSVTEDIKKLSEDTPVSDTVEIKDRKEVDNVISPEKYKKPSVARNLSSSIKRREPAAERIPLATMEVEVRKGTLTPPPQPIPATVKTLSASDLKVKDIDEKQEEKKTEETDSITEEISELPTAKAKYSEWSDDEEASGLPRSESRASRMSRAVRQLFCCGVPYEAPSDASLHHDYHTGI